jgi:hypothetical protein
VSMLVKLFSQLTIFVILVCDYSIILAVYDRKRDWEIYNFFTKIGFSYSIHYVE